MLIPYNDTACIVCVIAGRGTVTPYTLILRTLSRCTHVIQSYQTAGGSLVGNLAVDGDTEINADVTLAASSTNVELDVAFTRASVKSLGIICSAACTVKTNSSGAPQETITLVAGLPQICKTNAEVVAMFAGNVTKLYLSCAAGGSFSIRMLLDYTP